MLKLQSHAGRDLLQSAALFKTDQLVVWEYVANSIQYCDPGTTPTVDVRLDPRRKRISVSDNGSGMDMKGLQHFFTMHGENRDRKMGRLGRGRFGTGKSAAFGIANRLSIRTVKDGLQWCVELRRDEVVAAASGDPIPIKIVEDGIKCGKANGTEVVIEEINLRSLDQAGIIRFVERHLARGFKHAVVHINNHRCTHAEIPWSRELRFQPGPAEAIVLGQCELCVRVAQRPLEDEERGVQIYSKGNWYETTLAGCAGREMSQYLFGEIDISRIEEDDSPIPAFDMSRSMELNRNNEVVACAIGLISRCLDTVRRQLVDEERERKKSDEARKLAEEANKIASVLNEDFEEFRKNIPRLSAIVRGGRDTAALPGEKPGDLDGAVIAGEGEGRTASKGEGHGDGESKDGKLPPENAPEATGGNGDARSQPRQDSGRSGPKGGFRVEFRQMGDSTDRAHFESATKTIIVNLDHPQVAAAKSVEDERSVSFQRLVYEIAFCEYAIALASELNKAGNFLEPSDALFDVRETIDRLARRGASLFR